ncbi:MAG: DUF4870 domain-containing protein [Nitrospirae bacterium]|nr:DUF4870 domain-containing protein [Nitrospirota bacterium]
MRRIGIALIVAGILTGIAGLGVLAYTIVHYLDQKSVKSIHIPPGNETTTDPIQLIPDRPSRIAISMDVSTKPTKAEKGREGEISTPRYKFGVSYKIIDEKGNMLAHEDRPIEWNRGMKATDKVIVENTHATLTVKKSFSIFKVPKPGIIRISIRVSPDVEYGAVASNVILRVHNNLPQFESFIALGVIMTMAGPIIFVTGLIILIIGITRAAETLYAVCPVNPAEGAQLQGEAQAYGNYGNVAGMTGEGRPGWGRYAEGRMVGKPTSDETVLSVICHLAPLAGTIMVIGHVLIPLIILITKGKESEFVAYNARESLNFQLSMTIYWICTVVLMFVLVGILIAVPLAIFELSVMIKASIKASRGERYRVPMCIRFVK